MIDQRNYQFDADTHTYRINGRVVPSVTQVLADLIPGWRASDWHMQRGRAVHAAAALIAQNKDFDYDPQIEGQVKACRKFFAECIGTVLAVEKQIYSERYQYAGTFDLYASPRAGMKLPRWLIDYKSNLGPSVPYQLAAYAHGDDHHPTPFQWGVGVQLNADGTYRLSEVYDLRRYKNKWLALLTAYRVRRECGIKEEDGE